MLFLCFVNFLSENFFLVEAKKEVESFVLFEDILSVHVFLFRQPLDT